MQLESLLSEPRIKAYIIEASKSQRQNGGAADFGDALGREDLIAGGDEKIVRGLRVGYK